MVNLIVRAIVLLVLPTVVILSGGYLMQRLSGREQIDERLAGSPEGRGLGIRFTGYDSKAVSARWKALGTDDLSKPRPDLLKYERRGLELDLIFPFLYGGILAASLLCAWVALARPFAAVWLILPVAITVLADWTENLIQLGQLNLFEKSHGAVLQPAWIQVASVATMAKWFFLCGSSLLLIVLLVLMISRGVAGRS